MDFIIHGEVYAGLDLLDDNSVAVAITSPPYWRQRDYGFEGQIGQEETPEEYIGRLVVVFSKLRRKMRDDGVFFLNIGDKYLHRYGKSHLLQIPYRLAYHMIRDGWLLLDIIIWYKPNHMPSSVEDRFTNTYEPVMVLGRSERSIYIGGSQVVKIPLQQTPWKHTAIFPEKLVEEMLKRVKLDDGDLVLDPFAGTGTVGVVVRRMREGLLPKKIHSVLIERGDEFVNIMRQRTGIESVKSVEGSPYEWAPVHEERLPDLEPKEVVSDRHGEVFIANTTEEFLSALKGITTERFRKFHREDALYFFGVRNWTLKDLYYAHTILHEGYVLRNMLVVSQGGRWFPVFMFAANSTRVAYRFYLDRVRTTPRTRESRNWWNEDFIGMRVSDVSGKRTREGVVVHVLDRYPDGFPKIVAVRWDGEGSLEFVLHPERDELLMEGLIYRCPRCGGELEEPYDPVGDNICPHCGTRLWTGLESLPIVEEPPEVREIVEELESMDYRVGEVVNVERLEERRRKTRSKFAGLERFNWGASPGARKLMLGEYFTKMRLYRLDQPAVAQYLTILRRWRGLSLRDVIERLPSSYKHTAGHWFRKDFGGSIPVPEDITLLEGILGRDGMLNALRRTALKFQTVKASAKGRNPGDFIEGMSDTEIINYLKKLYLPQRKYIEIINCSPSSARAPSDSTPQSSRAKPR